MNNQFIAAGDNNNMIRSGQKRTIMKSLLNLLHGKTSSIENRIRDVVTDGSSERTAVYAGKYL